MAPRTWDAKMQARAQEVLAYVRQHGHTHSKDVQGHFDHGRIKRWGGNLNASTHLLGSDRQAEDVRARMLPPSEAAEVPMACHPGTRAAGPTATVGAQIRETLEHGAHWTSAGLSPALLFVVGGDPAGATGVWNVDERTILHGP